MTLPNPNQFFNLAGTLSVKPLRSMKQKTLLLFLLALFSVGMQGQLRPAVKSKPLHLNEFLASLGQSGSPERSRVESLLRDVHPTVYLTDGTVNITDASPRVLVTDMRSLTGVKSLRASDLATVELVTIKVRSAREVSQSIDLAPFSGLPQLRYVYILADDKSADNLLQNVQNADGTYQVFYNSMLIN